MPSLANGYWPPSTAIHAAAVRGMTAVMSSTTRLLLASCDRNGVVGSVGVCRVVDSARMDSSITITTFLRFVFSVSSSAMWALCQRGLPCPFELLRHFHLNVVRERRGGGLGQRDQRALGVPQQRQHAVGRRRQQDRQRERQRHGAARVRAAARRATACSPAHVGAKPMLRR